MKKITAIFLSLSLIAGMLTACSKDEFITVLRFTDNWNDQNNENRIALEEYLVENGVYSLSFEGENGSVLLRLVTDEKGYIEEIRITTAKVSEEGNSRPVTEEGKNLFLNTIESTISAFTYFSSDETEKIIKDMKLDELSSFRKNGELTLEKGNCRFVYYSAPLASMFLIYNIHLHPTEKTEKPESKPPFGNTTNIRTETVPLK